MLQVRLLGNVELYSDGIRLQDFPTQKSKALFAMLVLRPDRVFSRERIVDRFWSDLPEDRAKKCLSTDLWRIRAVIKSGGLEPEAYLVFRDQGVGFNGKAKHWLDVETFEANLSRLSDMPPEELTEAGLDHLEQSIELYRGDLLDDIYDDWVLVQREALRTQYMSALETLMLYHKHQLHLARAIAYGQKLLGLDPLLEHVHRELMVCHHQMGNRPAALSQFATCAELLRLELNVEPMEETQEVYQQVLATKPIVSLKEHTQKLLVSAPQKPRRARLSVYDGVRRAMENLQSAYSQLQDVNERLKADRCRD